MESLHLNLYLDEEKRKQFEELQEIESKEKINVDLTGTVNQIIDEELDMNS